MKYIWLCFFHLFVDEPGRFVNKSKSDGSAMRLTGDVELSCEVSTDDTVVVWKKEEKEVKEDQRTSLFSQGTTRKLIIKNAKHSDEGHYSCETAEDKVTFQVKIKGEKHIWYGASSCRPLSTC